MASADLKPSDHEQSDPASAEVQFALVIARMIESVRNNPADMRHAVNKVRETGNDKVVLTERLDGRTGGGDQLFEAQGAESPDFSPPMASPPS